MTTTYYVDGTNGNDSANGSQNNPLKTLVAAEQKVRDLDDDWIVRVVNGRPNDEAFGCPVFREPELGRIVFEPQEEVLASSSAGAGSSASKIVTSGLTDGALEGYSVEVETGAAAGKLATIRRNTTTEIFLAAAALDAIASGDSFRVFRPAAGSRLSPLSAEDPLVAGCGRPSRPRAVGEDRATGLRIENARIDFESGKDAYLSEAASLILLGCEIDNGGVFLNIRAEQALFGRAAWDSVLGGAQGADRAGWGVHFPGAFPVWDGVCGYVSGYVKAGRWIAFAGDHEITGRLLGPLRATGENNAKQAVPLPRVAFGKVAPFLPLVQKGSIDNQAGILAGVVAEHGAYVELGDNTEVDGGTVGAVKVNDARVRAQKDLSILGGTDGVRVLHGGEFVMSGVATISGGANLSGDEISVGNTPTVGDFADYSDTGDFLKDGFADDGSIFRAI